MYLNLHHDSSSRRLRHSLRGWHAGRCDQRDAIRIVRRGGSTLSLRRARPASVIVHGRNSHENQPRSPQRRRLIATRTIESIAPAPNQPKALLWNPAGRPRFLAFGMERLRSWVARKFSGSFLPRYDVFHLSRVAGLHLSGGRPVFPQVPQRRSEAVLASSKLTQAAQRPLDVARGVTLSTWFRQSVHVAA
jgi:hypothetical protein